MTTTSIPAKGPSVALNLHPAAGAASVTPRGPEWPRLTQSEMRRIVLDILG